MRQNVRFRTHRAALMAGGAAMCAALIGSTTDAAAVPAHDPSSWTVSSGQSGRGPHPQSWVGTACEGQFYHFSVSIRTNKPNILNWGGETSCTSNVTQILTVNLYDADLDPLSAVDAEGGQQVGARGTTTCDKKTKTKYVEMAYSVVNGVEANPYPAKLYTGTLPCRLTHYHS